MNLASFDIFDTVLIRKCGMPENIFWLLATHLFPNEANRQLQFVNWRINVGNLFEGDTNYSLTDIYSKWDSAIWNDIRPEFAYQKEKEIESEALTSNGKAIDIINQYREQGYTIAFISDMYLDSDFLIEILKRENILLDGDRVYVSNEYKARKDNGELYERVNMDLGPILWHHYGDNKISDYVIPKSKGIDAHLITTDYNSTEIHISDIAQSANPSWTFSTLSGICRAARIEFRNTPEAILAADFVAPMLISYIKHVINNAQGKGIRKLFFVARDGYILYHLAQQIPHDGISLSFVYLSRKSLIPSYLHGMTRDNFLNLYQNRTILWERVSDILNTVGLAKSSIPDINFDVIKDKEQENALLDRIFEPNCYKQWQTSTQEKNDLILKYFKQEGLFEDDIALVDVGWYGTTRMMVNSLRKQQRIANCFCYYIGIQRNALGHEFGDYNCFIDTFNRNRWVTCALESYFLVCPFATTIGYKKSENGVIPILKERDCTKEQYYYNENLKVASYMLSYVEKTGSSIESLRAWGKSLLYILVPDNKDIDYSPILAICDKETFSIKKLNLKDTWDYIRGVNSPLLNSISIDLTYNHKEKKIINYLRKKHISSRLMYLNIKKLIRVNVFWQR